jgi:membrane-associated phospholipid phosphatase
VNTKPDEPDEPVDPTPSDRPPHSSGPDPTADRQPDPPPPDGAAGGPFNRDPGASPVAPALADVPWRERVRRIRWHRVAVIVGVGGGLTASLYPLDVCLSRSAQEADLPGEVRREFAALEQYGQFVYSAIAMWIVALLDPRARRKLWQWIDALGGSFILCQAAKVLVGRPRPKHDDPWTILGPLEPYLLERDEGLVAIFTWQVDKAHSLHSMPSSHAMAATVMSVFLATLYPRLWLPLTLLAMIVGFQRVVGGAHYPSDVIAGATCGWLVTRLVIDFARPAEQLRSPDPVPAEAAP